MKKSLITFAVLAAAGLPAAAFAHTDVSIGLGVPVYAAPPPAVVYEQAVPAYGPPPPPPVVVEQPGYVYGPNVVYRGGYYDPRYYRPYGPGYRRY